MIRNILTFIILTCIIFATAKAYAVWSTSIVPSQQIYISSTGSDSNTGLSPSSPWQTIAHLNSQTPIPPGSTINLMTNLTGCFNLNNTNTLGPLTIQSYSLQVTVTCAANTHNFGNNYIGHMFDGIGGLTINNIKFTNPNSDAGSYQWTSNTNANFQFGILFQNSALTGQVLNTTFTNNIVTGYSQEVGFMFASAQSNWATCGPGFNGITVTGNTLGGTSTSSTDVAGIGFGGQESPNNGGPFCGSFDTSKMQNILVANNTVQYTEGSTLGLNYQGPFDSQGISFLNTQNAVVKNNYIHHIGKNQAAACPGPVATGALVSQNMLWQGNETAFIGNYNAAPATCDQDGINAGCYCLNCNIIGNFIHDVGGSGVFLQATTFNLFGGPGWSSTTANNVIQNSAEGGILLQNNNETGHNFLPALIYNNTIVTEGYDCFLANGTQSGPTGSIFENNICFGPWTAGGTNAGAIVLTPDATATTFDYNVYYVSNASQFWRLGSTNYSTLSAWQTATSAESHSHYADPLLLNANLYPLPSCSAGLNGPGNCPNVNVYAGSPVLAAGIAQTAATTDYYGNSLPSASPNIGASQQLPVAQTNIALDASVGNATGSLSLTTHSPNELIFAATQENNGSADCTIADTSSLTWTQLGKSVSGTSKLQMWKTFSSATLSSDTITFTCTGGTIVSSAAMTFTGALNIHDSNSSVPATPWNACVTISSTGTSGIIVAFERANTGSEPSPNPDIGFQAPVDANFILAEYYPFNSVQLGVKTNCPFQISPITGAVVDIWH